MCQMPNIQHIWHTKHYLTPFIRCVISCIFCNMLQQSHKFATVWTGVAYEFIIFFIPLSLSSLRQSRLLSNPNPHCSSTPTPTLTIESGVELNNKLDTQDMFFSKIKSPNEVGISPSSTFDERFKDSRYAFSVTKVGIFPLSLLRRFRQRWVGLVGSNVDVSR